MHRNTASILKIRKRFWVVSTLLFLLFSCGALPWTEAIRSGSLQPSNFSETVNIEVETGLVFIPVTIGDKTYRFLWDTGAMFSISEELQSDLNFPQVSTGRLTDSDNNKVEVPYVRLDKVKIGNVVFKDQTAFVGNFKANAILECLNIDGIIGSNLIRHCNWTIDQKNKTISLSETIDPALLNGAESIPFTTDRQYNIYISVKAGRATLNNILLDYGSNGSVTVSDEVFEVLKENNIINRFITEEGFKQSGIQGTPVRISRQSTVSDSIHLEDLWMPETGIRTGTSALFGNKVLSRYRVTIDWDNKKLHFLPADMPAPSYQTYGFRIGLDREEGLIIQSVVNNSKAHNLGIRPEMKVLNIDSLDFTGKHNFCDYIRLMSNPPDTLRLQLEVTPGNKQEYAIGKSAIPGSL